jgi:hypothetical protein
MSGRQTGGQQDSTSGSLWREIAGKSAMGHDNDNSRYPVE